MGRQSTFVEIVAGTLAADEGRIIVGGSESRRLTRAKPSAWEPKLSTRITFWSRTSPSPRTCCSTTCRHPGPGIYRYSACTAAAQAVLEELGIDVRPEALVRSLSSIQKKLVSIAKAFSRNVQVLVLDEPTGFPGRQGHRGSVRPHPPLRQRLRGHLHFAQPRRDLQICDRVTVFRDGRKTATRQVTT